MFGVCQSFTSALQKVPRLHLSHAPPAEANDRRVVITHPKVVTDLENANPFWRPVTDTMEPYRLTPRGTSLCSLSPDEGDLQIPELSSRFLGKATLSHTFDHELSFKQMDRGLIEG